jgi:hypothetical protein
MCTWLPRLWCPWSAAPGGHTWTRCWLACALVAAVAGPRCRLVCALVAAVAGARCWLACALVAAVAGGGCVSRPTQSAGTCGRAVVTRCDALVERRMLLVPLLHCLLGVGVVWCVQLDACVHRCVQGVLSHAGVAVCWAAPWSQGGVSSRGGGERVVCSCCYMLPGHMIMRMSHVHTPVVVLTA